jgi:hypothetical protein
MLSPRRKLPTPHPDEAAALHVLKDLWWLPFVHYKRESTETGARHKLHDGAQIWTTVCCLISSRTPGVWMPTGVKQPQVIVDFGHRSHRGTGFFEVVFWSK